MIDWDFDTENMPRDRKDFVLVAIKGSKTIRQTCFIHDDYQKRDGRWMNLRPDEEILAWSRMNYPVTEKPSEARPAVMLPQGFSSPPAKLPQGLSLPPGV